MIDTRIVMLSLSTVNDQGQLTDPSKLKTQLAQLKSGGVHGYVYTLIHSSKKLHFTSVFVTVTSDFSPES